MPNLTDLLGELGSYISFSSFTKVQERVIPSVLGTQDNIVVAAPTGSGKTLLLEVAILNLFRQKLSKTKNQNVSVPLSLSSDDNFNKGRKAVYICPIKALANEKYEHWTSLFSSLTVAIETGDHENTRDDSADSLEVVCGADIIITTPERWDSITRRWREKNVFEIVNSVALVLLDEIHIVHEERGAALEAIVSRMKAIKAITDVKSQATRFLAISGTMPNINDFATWLGVRKEMVFSFSPSDRPVPLTIKVIPFQNDSNNSFAFDRFLSFKLFHLVKEYAEGKPSIIFCSTRNQAVSSAQQLVQNIREAAERDGCLHQLEPSEEVRSITEKINDRSLRNCASVGIAFHHAALSLNDRRIIEDMFRKHYIVVVCTTTTLSLGVNLPAHLVIVKGTTFYNRGSSVDIPVSEVAQMCGRAGRPGMDDHGMALVLTTTSKQSVYAGLSSGEASFTIVESQLHRHIIEHVNAEVALHTITNYPTAVDWVKTTFFWLRLNAHPQHYGLNFANPEDLRAFKPEMYVELLMKKVLDALEEAKCISRTGDNNSVLESTSIGRSMSRLYISFGSVVHCNKTFNEQRKSSSLSELSKTPCTFSIASVLQLLSQCEEFSDIRLRQGDRGTLNALNKEIKFPLSNGFKRGREIREDWHKIYVLLQVHIMGRHLTDMSLRNDMFRLLSSVQRTVRFVKDYAGVSQSFSFILAAEQLKRSLEKKVWPDGAVLKQLSGITDDMVDQLNRGGVRSFADIANMDPLKIEAICSKPPPFGQNVLHQVSCIPIADMKVYEPINTNDEYKVGIGFSFRSVPLTKSQYSRHEKDILASNRGAMTYVLLVGDELDRLLLTRTITLSLSQSKSTEHYEFRFTPSGSCTLSVKIHLLAQFIVGCDVSQAVTPQSKKKFGVTEVIQSSSVMDVLQKQKLSCSSNNASRKSQRTREVQKRKRESPLSPGKQTPDEIRGKSGSPPAAAGRDASSYSVGAARTITMDDEPEAAAGVPSFDGTDQMHESPGCKVSGDDVTGIKMDTSALGYSGFSLESDKVRGKVFSATSAPKMEKKTLPHCREQKKRNDTETFNISYSPVEVAPFYSRPQRYAHSFSRTRPLFSAQADYSDTRYASSTTNRYGHHLMPHDSDPHSSSCLSPVTEVFYTPQSYSGAQHPGGTDGMDNQYQAHQGLNVYEFDHSRCRPYSYYAYPESNAMYPRQFPTTERSDEYRTEWYQDTYNDSAFQNDIRNNGHNTVSTHGFTPSAECYEQDSRPLFGDTEYYDNRYNSVLYTQYHASRNFPHSSWW